MLHSTIGSTGRWGDIFFLLVKLVGGGSVISGAYPVKFYTIFNQTKYLFFAVQDKHLVWVYTSLCPWSGRGEECRMRCYKEGVGYLAFCQRCHKQQLEEGKEESEVREEVYLGETSRSVVSRIKEHFQDYKTAMKKGRAGGDADGEAESSSWMADHMGGSKLQIQKMISSS